MAAAAAAAVMMAAALAAADHRHWRTQCRVWMAEAAQLTATVVGKEHGKGRYYIAQVGIIHTVPALRLQQASFNVDHQSRPHVGCWVAVHAQRAFVLLSWRT